MEKQSTTTTVQEYQRFRFKDQVVNVPIYLINNKPFVFLDDIQNICQCNVRRFMVNNNPLLFSRNNLGHQEEPLRIRANINEIIDCDEIQEIDVGQSIHDKMDLLIEELTHLRRVADRTFENTEELKIKVDAILKQIFELAEFTVPRLFIILPEETSKLNPANLFQHSYRLYFLCECEEQRHLALHEGYEINQPREFIRKYGPYLKRMITVVKLAVAAGSIVAPILGAIGPHIPVPTILNNPILLDSFGVKLDKMDNVLNTIKNEDKLEFSPDTNLEGADLREVESFLKKNDENRRLGNLYRTVTNTGNVRWVCVNHYRKFYSDKKNKESQKRFRSLNGIIRDDEIIIDENSAQNFDQLLTIISEGLCRFKITLRNCKIKKSQFEEMLNIVSQRPDIKCLELFSIHISYPVPFMITHKKIITELEQTLEKRKDLTIKYIVKYPEDNSALDPDLFDYALKQSTERLRLQFYTRYDGKKIVLENVDQPILHRIVRSLKQSQMISHCTMNQFDRELSNILLDNTTITNLTIFSVEFDEQRLTALRQLLTKRKKLRELRCSSCKNLSPLIAMLSQELVTNTQLNVLAINGISENHQLIQLFTMLRKNNHLIELNLALDTGINAQTMIQISDVLKTNTCLRKLKLTGIQGVVHKDPNLNLFEYFLRNTSIEQLTVHFHDCQTPISLCETIEATENVKILELSQCYLVSNKMIHGISSTIISDSLITLCLHSCQLSLEEAVDLFQSLTQNETLTTLSLTNIHIQDDIYEQIFFEELANMLCENTGLKKLTYSGGNLGDEGVAMIGQAFEANETLEELNISSNRINVGGATSLAIALANNNALLLLNIQGNYIPYAGIHNILWSLKNNRMLQHLYISELSYKHNLSQFNEAKEELFNVNEIINIY